MARLKRRILRIIGWIIGGFLGFTLLITIVFYIGRGWITDRALSYLNTQQPGEVQIGKLNLVPFMNFPDVSVQLKSVSYYEYPVSSDSLHQEPVISLEDIFVSMDVIDLIRGDIIISRARLADGNLHLILYEDSITNLEKALGFRFSEKDNVEKSRDSTSSFQVDLNKLQLSNIQIVLQDLIHNDHLNLQVNEVESGFSYLSGKMQLDIKLDVDINSFKYLTIKSQNRRNLQFSSDVLYDPLSKEIQIEPSSLSLSGLFLEVWGSWDMSAQNRIDLTFRARNTGLDILNYLFRGVLDMDELEQIGSGKIYLSGTVSGPLGDKLPLIRLNASADGIGFSIKSIQKEITDISFEAFATNGSKEDLEEGELLIKGFTASFPEGTLHGDLSLKNPRSPEVHLELGGDVNLQGLEKMINTNKVQDLHGQVILDGRIDGVINRGSGEFLNDAGSVKAQLVDVGFRLEDDVFEQIDGEIFMEENRLGAKDLQIIFNGNSINLGVELEDLLLYMMDFEKDVNAQITVASETLGTASLLKDSALVSLLGEELNGLQFKAGALIPKEELDTFLQEGTAPEMVLTLDSFYLQLSGYADISNMNASLKIEADTLIVNHFNGIIGESGFHLEGMMSNYSALGNKDSATVIGVEYKIASDLMRAADFFTFNEEFLLPSTYQGEYLENFRLSGSLQAPVADLLIEAKPVDFNLSISELGWNFRYYPLAFKDFLIDIRRDGSQLFVDKFQGRIGESNLDMTASIGNFTDSLRDEMYGNLVLESDLLDFNELLNYNLPDQMADTLELDSSELREPPRLDQIDYPDFDFQVNIGELRYDTYTLFGMEGALRATREKILFLDHLVTSTQSGGRMEFNGQFTVSNPWQYTLSTELDFKDVNIRDLNIEMQSGEEIYTLRENFAGILTAKGLAEIYITPDLKLDMASTTAVFDVRIRDGALINFTPLNTASKYLDNKDLNNVKFANLRNRFTLIDSRIYIPLMSIGSSIGQLLIEGEQGLDNSYLYLLRIPKWLVKGAAKSLLSGDGKGEEEEQIYEMETGRFMRMTIWSDGEQTDMKLGDKRDKFE